MRQTTRRLKVCREAARRNILNTEPALTKDIVAGYIYYPRAKNPAPIMIKGIYDNGTYDLRERLDDGTTTGYICLKCDKDENWSGGWANPTTHKELKLTDISFSHEAQKWFTKSLFLEE